MKTRLKRVLSLALTALMLLMLVPGAFASEIVTSEPVVPGLGVEKAAEPEKSAADALYEQIMAAQNCETIYYLIADDNSYEAAISLTVAQVYTIREHAHSLDDDGYQDILVQTLNELLKYLGEDIDSGYDIDSESDINERYYRKTIPVYWDTTTGKTTNSTSADGAHIQSVSLGNANVVRGDSSKTSSSWSGGKQLQVYFPTAYSNSTSSDNYQMADATLSITAEQGYYVTSVVVACAPTTSTTPYVCSTWKAGNEFIQEFNLTNSVYTNDGLYKLDFSINSRNFSHDGRSAQAAYFILIQVATVPTPLYVEYNYGNVADFLTIDSDSAFNSPTWTQAGSGNNYGSGSMYTNGILTNDTQFAYQYPNENTSVIANWSHTANTVSPAALEEAAAAGYYFAGWSATWYNSCSASYTTNSYNDNYALTFSNIYMTGSYAPGDAVQLPTNVRLVAQWKPIQLKVTKTVEGLSSITEHASKNNTYTLLLQNLQNGNYVELQSKNYAITGDGTLTYTFAIKDADVALAITPGTYRVEESGNYDLTGTSENAYCSTTYPVQTVEVKADGTVQELKVLNTYSSTPAKVDLTITKQVTGNMGDRSKSFNFEVISTEAMTAGENYTLSPDGKTATFSLTNGTSVTLKGVTIGDDLIIRETNANGYTVTITPNDSAVKQDDGSYKVTVAGASTSLTVTNHKNAIPDMGVLLDSLPYILILAVVVAVGAFVFIRKRREHDDD